MIEAPDILERLRNLIARGGRLLGIMDRSIVSQSRALELIDMLVESLPLEMTQAREIQEKREEILEDAKNQAGDIIDDAVRKAEKLVDADAITIGAKKRAEEMKMETEAYIRERLAGLEAEIENLLEEVRNGLDSLAPEKEDTRIRKL